MRALMFGTIVLLTAAAPARAEQAAGLESHAAVYDMAASAPAVGALPLSGELSIEVEDLCEGYASSHGTRLGYAALSPLAYSAQGVMAFETKDGSLYRFRIAGNRAAGLALLPREGPSHGAPLSGPPFPQREEDARDQGAFIEIRPGEETTVAGRKTIPPQDVVFPIKAERLLLEAARRGETRLALTIFRGADAAPFLLRMIYSISPAAAPADLGPAKALAGRRVWRVRQSSYDASAPDMEPHEETDYLMADGGVALAGVTTLGGLRLAFRLRELTFKETACD